MAITGFEFKKYGYAIGTSFSSPFAMTLASIYKTKYPSATVVDFLTDCTVDIGQNGYDEKTGLGMVVLPSLENPLSFKMKDLKGNTVFVHKDFVDVKLKQGYTI